MGSGGQTARQQARRQVGEAHAVRLREWADRERELAAAAVDVVAALVDRDRAEERAGVAVRSMLALRVSVAEVAQRCCITPQLATKLKHAAEPDASSTPGTQGPVESSATAEGGPR
jgi:hypothetical protein